MITKNEIEAKAIEFEIPPTSVEKDYVFGWLIFGIFTVSELKDQIFLKGGNALRKGYLNNTRYSGDLDFGIPRDIRDESLLEEMNKVCAFIQENAGVVFVCENNKVEEKFTAIEAPTPDLKVYEVSLYFKDFYGNADHIKLKVTMDVTRFDKVQLPIQNVKLIHPYSDSDQLECSIRCMKLEEIIATKLKCLMQRQHAPDLFDYAYSIQQVGGSLNKKEVVEVFVRKTIFGRNPQFVKKILASGSFDFFKKHWVKTIVCAKQLKIGVEEAIEIFLADLEQLFSSYPDNGYADFAFFGPELRHKIIEAGRGMKLMKITYHGSERIIEPYSLKYMQRKDGQRKEYFYVYNTSGGSNPPGVRCFLSNDVESLEVLEESYRPRFQIELSKAGELPENPYLFDPNKPLMAPKRVRSFFSPHIVNKPKYIYQCSYCGKQFSRTSRSSALNAHKNKSGYPCRGRTGFYVTTKY